MALSHVFRFFLPMENPFGFGISDFIELGLAFLLALILLLRGRIETAARKLAARPLACMAIVSALPVVLRLLLLGSDPVPAPQVSDDFSYLLLGDTLAHFRLANPMHPMHRFFEGVFTLQTPSYASNFPIGQGIALAIGQLLFHLPWAGVLLSVGLLCGLCYWMLAAWVPPVWALSGGILAALEFGPLSSWMNSYWGGAVAGIAGCLVFGALPRLRKSGRTRDAVLLGAGLGLQMLSRPYESVLLLAGVAVFFIPLFISRRSLMVALLAMMPAAGLTLLQNKQVAGSWTTLPYQLSRYQYGIPTTFTFQQLPVPHNPLTVEQTLDYEGQAETHGKGTDTLQSFLERLGERARFYRFFFFAPLYFALPFFLPSLREARFRRVLMVIAILWAGTTCYPYFYPHYIAGATCLFVLIGIEGLRNLSRIHFRGFPVGAEAAQLILLLCLAHFLFWFGIHATGSRSVELATAGYESWNSINSGDPEGRLAVNRQLAQAPGRQLVFVHYWPQHGPYEWIHNAADIDASQVVWALDLGPEEDARLRKYYPDRTVWMLEPDAHPPRLTQVPAVSR